MKVKNKFSNCSTTSICMQSLFDLNGYSAKVLFIDWQVSNHMSISMRFNVDCIFTFGLMSFI